MRQSEGGGTRDTLNGWKDIAVYVGKSVRSVQRWERDLQLPVHRIITPDQGQIVYASRKEIDRWRRALDSRPDALDETAPFPGEQADTIADSPGTADPKPVEAPPTTPMPPVAPDRGVRTARYRPLLWAAVVLASIAIGIAVGRWMERRGDRLPDRLAISGTALQALSSTGRPLWRHDFGEVVSSPPSIDIVKTDLEGDGVPEFIVPVRAGPGNAGHGPSGDRLLCVRADGSIVWQVDPEMRVSLRDRRIEGPWHVRALTSPGAAADGKTWAVFNHNVWSPALVIEVDPTGQWRIRFAQSGQLASLAYWPTPRGPMLAVGGVDNEQERASIAVIDLHAEPAQFPETEAAIMCVGCPTGVPAAYFALPPAEVTLIQGRAYATTNSLSADTALLEFSADDDQMGYISPDLKVMAIRHGDNYWAVHRNLEGENRIGHLAEKCPERGVPREIRTWTPRSGWVTSQLMPDDSRDRRDIR